MFPIFPNVDEVYYKKNELINDILGDSVRTYYHIHAGDKLYHITPLDFCKINEKQSLFLTHTVYDRHLYRVYLSMKLRRTGFQNVKEVTFVAKKDIIVPNPVEQKKIFDNMIKSTKTTFFTNYLINIEDIRKYDNLYKAYMYNFEHINEEAFNVFYEQLLKNGYNAVLDIHDISGTWMQAKRPIFLPNASDFLEIKSIKKVYDSDIIHSLIMIGDVW